MFWGCAEAGDWPECLAPVYGCMQAELEPGMGSEPQVQGSSLRDAPLLVAPLPNLRSAPGLLAACLQWLSWIPIPLCLAGILLATSLPVWPAHPTGTAHPACGACKIVDVLSCSDGSWVPLLLNSGVRGDSLG